MLSVCLWGGSRSRPDERRGGGGHFPVSCIYISSAMRIWRKGFLISSQGSMIDIAIILRNCLLTLAVKTFLVCTCPRRPGRSSSQPHVQRPRQRHVTYVREGRYDQPGPVAEVLVAVKESCVGLPRHYVVRRLLRKIHEYFGSVHTISQLWNK